MNGAPETNQCDFEIPPEQWLAFLDAFSRQHRSWLATIEVVSPGGSTTVVEAQPLQGVSIDHGGVPPHAYLEMGETKAEHVTHVVHAPARIRFQQSPRGEHRGLEIVSADGTTTILRFRSMMCPEMLDGIAV